ncbi:hypothetical protein [Saccharothrix australiensis]|nr:hypothetical protein [Saccharothrix australiensis]
MLFDLVADPSECADRSGHEPELLADLRADRERIDADLLPYPS